LKESKIDVHKKNKSIAIPNRKLTDEEAEAIIELCESGYLKQEGIY
jgi:hypothetical protein